MVTTIDEKENKGIDGGTRKDKMRNIKLSIPLI
jgi:hypothetical protein